MKGHIFFSEKKIQTIINQGDLNFVNPDTTRPELRV